jgi:hypothetical protein
LILRESPEAMAIAICIAWVIGSNAYFGWNWRPQSDAELLADGIGLILAVVALNKI